MTKGIDISHWQSTTPDLTGLDFVFCRATYATSKDDRWDQHSLNVRKAGLVLGAYAFGDGRSSGAEQARALLGVAGDADLLCLDLESDGPNGVSMTQAQAREFIAYVQKQGRKIGLYHSASGFPDLGQDWNWVARWGMTAPSTAWAFWQWQGSPLDKNLFNGTVDQLRELADMEQRVITTTITVWPAKRQGSYPASTRRFAATSPHAELSKLMVAGTSWVDAQVVIDQAGVPHGSFLRLVDAVGKPRFLVASSSVTLADVPADPRETIIDQIRKLVA